MTATQPFFSSRWIEVPANVTERGRRPAARASAPPASPAGSSRAAQRDLGLLVSDAPPPTSAARFTRSGTQSAPVLLCRERCTLDGIRAVVVNSGNANAATGRPGYENAAKMQGAARSRLGRRAESAVAVASTGVIGVPLPMTRSCRGSSPPRMR